MKLSVHLRINNLERLIVSSMTKSHEQKKMSVATSSPGGGMCFAYRRNMGYKPDEVPAALP